VLRERNIGTLLFDLLTRKEELLDQKTAHLRFDIPLLAKRLVGATLWVTEYPQTRGFRIGYFGASTGAAAALVAAAELPEAVAAVVSRGGRPDLAHEALDSVHAPTLLIVGGADEIVLGLNREALARISQPGSKLVVIPGATHLFEEPGALEEVAEIAGDWFQEHFSLEELGEKQAVAVHESIT
jgi:putative phosphoribosyl transferase